MLVTGDDRLDAEEQRLVVVRREVLDAADTGIPGQPASATCCDSARCRTHRPSVEPADWSSASVVFGPSTVVPSAAVTIGYAGVASALVFDERAVAVAVAAVAGLTNQSRPHGTSSPFVDFETSFCIEMEPSEHVVWLWKSPVTYVPPGLPALATGAVVASVAPSAAVTAMAILVFVNSCFMSCRSP